MMWIINYLKQQGKITLDTDKNHGDILDTADSHNSRLQEFLRTWGI